MENQENNKKPNKTLIIRLIILTLILLVLIFSKNHDTKYKITTEEMLSKLKQPENNTIAPEKLLDIIQNNDSSYQFIDLRTPREFAKGSIYNAINIPLQNILSPEFRSILNQDKKINVLYYSNHLGACGPWMLLTQSGFKNNKILLGGYDFVKNYIVDDFSPMTGNFKDENPKYNYSQIINSLKGNGGTNTETSSESSITVPVVKKEKKTQAGGC